MLDKRQKQVLDFIQHFQEKQGKMPSAGQISQHFGFQRLSTADAYLNQLQKFGYLKIVDKPGIAAGSNNEAENFNIFTPLIKEKAWLKKLTAFVTSFGFLISLGLGTAAIAAVTISNTGITGDSSFTNVTVPPLSSGLLYATSTGQFVSLTIGSGLTLSSSTLSAAASGTVTHTAGALTDGSVVIGNGGADVTTLASPFSATTNLTNVLLYNNPLPCISGDLTAAKVAALGAVTKGSINIADVTEPFAVQVSLAYEGTIFTATGNLSANLGTSSSEAFYMPAFSLKQSSPVINFGASGMTAGWTGTTHIALWFNGANNLSGVGGGPLSVKICGVKLQ